MKIPREYEKYFEYIEAGNNIELKDEQTKLIVRAEHGCYKVIVDRGIVEKNKKKCDFAIADETDKAGIVSPNRQQIPRGIVSKMAESCINNGFLRGKKPL